MADVSRNLAVAFSAVILALIAAALTYWIAHVRRRWYACDLLAIDIGPEGERLLIRVINQLPKPLDNSPPTREGSGIGLRRLPSFA